MPQGVEVQVLSFAPFRSLSSTLKVTIRHSYDPAPARPADAPDAVVFFDVFRASTTLLCLAHSGAEEIVMANDEATCRELQRQGHLLVSEVFSGGFDNSPTQILAGPFKGRRVVHKSTNLSNAVFHNPEIGRAHV